MAEFQLQPKLDRRLRELAGSAYDRLIADRTFAIATLDHPSPQLQLAALSLFVSHWEPDITVEEICESKTSVSSQDVALQAITTLAFVRCKLNGKKISETLAEYASDVSLSTEMRQKIYRGMQFLFGTDSERSQALQPPRELAEPHLSGIDRYIINDTVSEVISRRLDPLRREAVEYHKKGKEAFAERRFEEAIHLFGLALQAWRTPGPLLYRAKAKELLGMLDEALADCNEAIALMPSVTAFYRQREQLFERRGEFDKANADRKKAISLERGQKR